jgi:hypothetical protein
MNRLGHIIVLLVLIALVFILFGKTLNNHFNSDDYLVVYQASQTKLTPPEVVREFLRPSWGLYYRPLITLFFDVLESWFGIAPTRYHLISLLCYSVLCAEVYLLGLLLTKKIIPAFAAALLFMTMNAHAEAIFWISSLNGIVENIFSLASLIFFILWRNRLKPPLYLISVGLFLVALFLKESAIALPLVLILYDALLGGGFVWPQALRRAAKSTSAFFATGIAFVILRWFIMRQVVLPPPLTSFNLRAALLGSWQVILMTLSPIDWALLVHWFNTFERRGFIFYLFAALSLLIIAGLPLLLKKHRLLFLLGWMFAGVVPIILLGLAPSERHVVFSSAGAAVLIAIALSAAAERLFARTPLAAKASALFLVFVFSATSFYFLNQRRVAWKTASDIAASIVAQTVTAYPAPQSNETFFFLNAPDTYDGAFVFRFENLAFALRLFYKQPSVEAVRIVTSERIPPEILSNTAYAYFRISAMGGNITHVKAGNNLEFTNKISNIPFLSKNCSFLDNWTRYRNSPFLVYSQGRLIPSSPEQLKDILQDLYSLS